jgi:hypothetical protein
VVHESDDPCDRPRAAGVRVPIGVESIAQVRFADRSEMTMTYRYEMVNGLPVTSSDVMGGQ